ncbi:MAG: preprotein translocase subunit YajC [Gemmatimonadales bacterium]
MTFNLLLMLQAQPDTSRGFLTMLWYLVGFGAIFYFFFIRPRAKQEKEHREKIQRIKRGDRVVTMGGIIAEVVHIKDSQLTVKSGESRLVVQRERIAEVLTGEEEGEKK